MVRHFWHCLPFFTFILAAIDFDLYTPTTDLISAPAGITRRDASPVFGGKILLAGTDNPSIFMNVSVGTPPQRLLLALESKNYIWLPRKSANASCAKFDGCDVTDFAGTYDSQTSKTFKNLTLEYYSVAYGGGTLAGSWCNETFAISNTTIKNMPMLVADRWVTGSQPAIGLGKDGVGTPSILTMLKESRQIDTASFGLYYNDQRSSQGSLVFGGVDVSKFFGDMQTFDSENVGKIPFTGVSLKSPRNTGAAYNWSPPKGQTYNTSVTFTSGALFLPQDMLDEVRIFLGGVEVDSPYGSFTLPCGTIDSLFSAMTVHFRNISIDIPVSQLYSRVDQDAGTCVVKMVPPMGIPGEQMELGLPFLNAAYVYYDFDNSQVSLAPLIANVSHSTVVNVPVSLSNFDPRSYSAVITVNSDDPIVNLTLAANVNATVITTTNTSSTANGTNSTDSSSSAHTQPPFSSTRSTNTGVIVGAVVGGVVAVALIAIGIWLYLRRKRLHHQPSLPLAQPLVGELPEDRTVATKRPFTYVAPMEVDATPSPRCSPGISEKLFAPPVELDAYERR